jgi:hypothetical protein
MDEVFYEFKKLPLKNDLTGTIDVEIIIHFLAKLESSIVLYETKIMLNEAGTSNIDKRVIEELDKVLKKYDANLNLVKGKIREIFLSYSS